MARRISVICVLFLFIMCMATGASAQTTANNAELLATVTGDGSCQVTLTVELHLEQVQERLLFPLPSGAYSISVNGVRASASRNGDVVNVDLTQAIGQVSGDIRVTLLYTLPSVVSYNDSGALILTLPLLSGFAYPVEGMEFTVTLPGDITARPTFTSVYYQTRVEESMTVNIEGASLTGTIDTTLMEQDSVTMTLPVDESLFPQQQVLVWTMDLPDFSMIAFAVLAVVYWLIFLRCPPYYSPARPVLPDGISAGEVGTALTGQGTDLTMLVVQWAQLGYVLIQLDDHGRVILHKRMDMGNERSESENRIFTNLFARRNMVDGTGLHYAQLYRKVASAKPSLQGIYRRGSGNVMIFRVIAGLIGACGGASLGLALGNGSVLQLFIAAFLTILGFVGAWLIQEGCFQVLLRGRLTVLMALGICIVWLVLGALAAELNVAAWAVFSQFLAGLAAAYSGRRTDRGKQAFRQVLGLRRYLRRVDKATLQRIMRTDPDYFYSLAPYALALGVDQTFARHFGTVRLEACPYLSAGMNRYMTAAEWARLLRDAVNTLDERQEKLFWERLLGK